VKVFLHKAFGLSWWVLFQSIGHIGHELCHYIMSLLMFTKPQGINIDAFEWNEAELEWHIHFSVTSSVSVSPTASYFDFKCRIAYLRMLLVSIAPLIGLALVLLMSSWYWTEWHWIIKAFVAMHCLPFLLSDDDRTHATHLFQSIFQKEKHLPEHEE